MRKWRRTFQRASEVEASLPDPILMIWAFDGPASHVAKADPQASFRLAQSRMELAVHEKPTTEKVWVFSQVVAAELETLTLLDSPKALELSASFAGATMGSVGHSHGGPSDRAKPVMGQGNWRRPTPKPSSIPPPDDDDSGEWERVVEV